MTSRTYLLPAIAALAAAVAPTAASADAADTLARALPIARAAWPGSPCAGRETVQITDRFVDPSESVIGEADLDGSCNVRIRPGLDAYDFCVTLVHEFGHLAGRTHADVADHEGVMTGDPWAVRDYSPCDAMDRETPRQAAAATLRSRPARCHQMRHSLRGRLYRCGHRRSLAFVALDRTGGWEWVQLVKRSAVHDRRLWG